MLKVLHLPEAFVLLVFLEKLVEGLGFFRLLLRRLGLLVLRLKELFRKESRILRLLRLLVLLQLLVLLRSLLLFVLLFRLRLLRCLSCSLQTLRLP